jgi:hypothetical protein
MEFNVIQVGGYLELNVRIQRATIESGLLNEMEAFSLGSDMFDAVRELVGSEALKEFIKDSFTQEELFGDEDD